jgi:hypothetical protein
MKYKVCCYLKMGLLVKEAKQISNKTKYVFVTGGVLSSVGKGIVTSSIGKMLQVRGFDVTVIKVDPYVNVDAGTMNPYIHGEVFVTEDGGETDLDLGGYERFLNINLPKENNITTGQIYQTVINSRRHRRAALPRGDTPDAPRRRLRQHPLRSPCSCSDFGCHG